ncbi:MAG: hypothetical protein KHY35_20380 [Bacteroides thetaiotaomicron]|uniref:Uncharacterized protein n=1 Tax=Bacteroides thetaiotaomicron TaxID=818 RepID=A0A943DYR2_BACT4|nr:hypothetical protein [Bacteroides thetaiotaomicron]MBS5413031.1 hypothetical protein [Bacteroides thetaiotaomicron]
MKTFADIYRNKISSYVKCDLIKEKNNIQQDIGKIYERLETVSNEKKIHDLKVAISRNKIKIREINKLLVETEQ